MTIPASHCEAVLRGMSKQANKDGDWIEVKFQVHPQEVPQALWDANLRSRWQLAFVEIGDDEQPKQPVVKSGKTPLSPSSPPRKPATTRAEKARRLCGVAEFWDFIEPKVRQEGSVRFEGKDRYEVTSNFVKWFCGVKSKAELDKFENQSSSHNPAACWDMLLSEYEQQTGRMAERH